MHSRLRNTILLNPAVWLLKRIRYSQILVRAELETAEEAISALYTTLKLLNAR